MRWPTLSAWPINSACTTHGFQSITPTPITGICPRPCFSHFTSPARPRNIRLGTAIICLNLHHPLDVAEQVAVADLLTGGRMAVGFGSGSTPEEFSLFGLTETADNERHARFAEALRIIRSAWSETKHASGNHRAILHSAAPSAAGSGSRPGPPLMGCGQQPGLGTDRRDV